MIVWNEFLNDARVLKEAQTLQSAGYKVTVFALHTPGVTKQYETTIEGIKIARVPRSPLWRFRSKHRNINSKLKELNKPRKIKTNLFRLIARCWTHLMLLYKLQASRPSVIHSHDVNTLPTAWLASVIRRVPLVYDAHEISTDREGYQGLRKLVGLIEKILMPRAAATITTTEMRAKFFRRAYRIHDSSLVLQNRPRYSKVYPSEIIRNQLNLEENWPIILYQGGLQQGRGLFQIIDAAAKTKNAYFVFIGTGRLEQQLRAQAIELKVERKVFFLGKISLEKLHEYTMSADIGLQNLENTCLNHFSTDSNKVFEYMMAGLPIIATKLPEIRKIVETHSFGILIDENSSNQLADSIQFLVNNPQMRQRFQKNAKKASVQMCWEEQEHKLVNLYHNLRSS